jgi:hypothetical protein
VIFLARIFAKEVAELAQSRGLLLIGFIAPVAMMLLIGNLGVRVPVIHVAIIPTQAEKEPLAQLRSFLEELSGVEVVEWPSGSTDARWRSVRENVDLVIIWESGWRFYSPLTDSFRLQLTDAVVQNLALSIARDEALKTQLDLLKQLADSVPGGSAAEASGSPAEATSSPAEATSSPAEATRSPAEATSSPAEATSSPAEATRSPAEATSSPAEAAGSPAEATRSAAEATSSPAEAAGSPAEAASSPQASDEKKRVKKPSASSLVKNLEQEVKAGAFVPIPVMGEALSGRLVPYFPLLSKVNRSAVPGFIALITVFLPFLFASGGLVKEREAGTLETLVLAVRRNWAWIAFGKLILPLCAGIVCTLLLLVAARTAYGFGIKPGLGPALAVQVLAALVSALLGLSISTIIRSQQEAYLISALYLLGLVLVTGIIYPIQLAGLAVILASYAFPLTFSGPAFESWMMKGGDAVLNFWQVAGLLCQFLVSSALCAMAFRRTQRSL